MYADVSTLQTGTAFTINGDEFISPSVPVLLQILSSNTSATSLLPSGSVYYLDRNKTVEITIPGGAAGSPHPYACINAIGSVGLNTSTASTCTVTRSG